MKSSQISPFNPPSRSDKRIKTGSNVRGRGLSRFHSKQFAELEATLREHREKYHRKAMKLVSKRELREAIALSEQIRGEAKASVFSLGQDAAAWRKNREKFRLRAAREISKTVRAGKDLRALASEEQREFGALVKRFLVSSVSLRNPFEFGELPELEPTARIFKPPFPLFDVSHESAYPNNRNDSFAVPRIGHVINNLHVSLSEHTSTLNGIFGLDGLAFVFNRSGCGFNFTVPRSGKLRIIVELEHFHTRIRLTLSDNFGFSEGEVSGASSIFVSIIRGTSVVQRNQTMVFDGLISHGSDLTTLLPSPEVGTIFTFDSTTDEIFDAGAAVQIIAGCQFTSGARLDDMEAIADALLWHKVRQIAVDVV